MTNLIPDQLLETFARNARVNEFLLDHLTDADLTLSDGRGGDTALQLLSHMASARGGWLLDIGLSPEHASELQNLAGGVNLWEWQASGPAEVRAMLTAGDRAVLKAVQAHVQAGNVRRPLRRNCLSIQPSPVSVLHCHPRQSPLGADHGAAANEWPQQGADDRVGRTLDPPAAVKLRPFQIGPIPYQRPGERT